MNLVRTSLANRLRETRSIDVLIIGGGINGAGLLRELALNGVDAILVDKGDFASGATSGSSRMIHGGLRYLENGEFRLVRESLRERNRLLRNAPHAVFPLPTTIPIFSRWSGFGNAMRKFFSGGQKPSKRGAALVKLGLTLYDLFTVNERVLPRHHFQSRTEALRRRPSLNSNIVCTATYYDASIQAPGRLCLELLDDAVMLHPGALALNYCAAVGLADGAVILREAESGEEFRVRPRIVVNATGAWIDFTDAALGAATRFIGGTKGSHLILDHPELLAATQGEQIYYENEDGRICILFAVNGRVLVGSTDIRIDDPDQAVCDEHEVDYILESVRWVFPSLRIDRSHVVGRFCGVRPLPRSEDGFTGRISRDHSIRELRAQPPVRPWPVYALVGGKWTTFRALAADVTDRILGELNRTRKADSRKLTIGGRTPQLDPASPDSLRGAIRAEAVVHLDDLLLRRTDIALFGTLDELRYDQIATVAATELGWDLARLMAEKTRTQNLLRTNHGVTFKNQPVEAI